MARLDQPMFDVVLGAGIFEGVRGKHLATIHRAANVWGRRADVSRRGEMRAVVGQDGMDPVGDGSDEGAKEIPPDPPGGFLMQFDKGELGGQVDGDQQVELALRGVDLGDVDVEVAERIGLELASGWRSSFDIGQAGDAVSLEAAVQG